MLNDKTRLFVVLAVIVMAFCLVLLLVAAVSLFADDATLEAEANSDDGVNPSASTMPLTNLPLLEVGISAWAHAPGVG